MSHLANWDIDESAFEELTKHVKKHLDPFKHSSNQDIELQVVGYISSQPGIIYEIVNVYEFSQSEIDAWKHILNSYGADHVEIGIDTMNKVLTMNVYYEPKKEKKIYSGDNSYKICAWYRYIPNFVWIYFVLLLWNPTRYNPMWNLKPLQR